MKVVFLNFFALGFIITLASSCTTTKIDSNKSPNFNQKVSKIFLTVRGSEGSKEFMKPLTTSLVSELTTQGVECNYYTFDPLSLETEKDLIEKIKIYNPDVVMTVVQTERRMASGNFGGTETGVTLDIRLFIPNQDNPVWRASVKVNGDFEMALNPAKQATAKIIEKLKMDGIINSN